MIFYSCGMPLIMQQIGDSVFWNAQEDLSINYDIAISNAAIELGNKQIKSKLNKIKSNHYEDIFLRLGELKALEFKKSEVKEKLTSEQKNVFNDFLKRSKELNILESVGKENSGEYAFVNRLYFAYFLIKSIEKKYRSC